MNRARPPPSNVRRVSSRATPGETLHGFRRPTLRPPTPPAAADDDGSEASEWEEWQSDPGPDRAPIKVAGIGAHEIELDKPRTAAASTEREIKLEDVQGKSCWICLGDEDDSDSNGKAWAHPCHCSLIAHEKCLLVWVASQEQAQSKSGPVACPQCKEPFTIFEESSLTLQIFNAADEIISKGCAGLILTSLASSFVITSGLLGYSSLRCYLGKDATTLLLGRSVRSWPVWALATVPLIPYAQITSAFSSDILSVERFTFLESAIILLPIFFLPRAPQNPLLPAWSAANPRLFSLTWSFPPGPGMTLALLPALNVVYLNVKRRVQRSVLLGTGLFAPWSNSRVIGGRRNRTFTFGDNTELLGVDVQIEIVNARDEPPPPPPALADEALYLTRHSVTRLALGALLTPSLSAAAGWGLEKVARNWSQTLARVLGLKGVGSTGKGGWLMGTAGRARGGWGGRAGAAEEGELDPVWWRNAIGGCLLVLVKDSLSLFYKYLRLQQRKSRRVKNRNFAGLDIGRSPLSSH